MMKKQILCSFALFAIAAGAFAQKSKKPELALKSKSDSLSYALGQNITRGLKQHLVATGVLKDTTANDVGFKSFVKGLEEAVSNTDLVKNAYFSGIGIGSQLNTVTERFEDEMLSGDKLNKDAFLASVLSALAEEKSLIDNPEELLQKVALEKQEAENIKQAEELKALHGERISEEAKFLAENKEKEGVVTLPNGLQYKIIKEGDGVKPLKTDRVTVHYEGRLLDGTVFDSSYERGEPATFGVTQVIKGWTDILQIMPVGSKWTVYIPYDLAYGERDQGVIKPFSTLIFDIELIDVVK